MHETKKNFIIWRYVRTCIFRSVDWMQRKGRTFLRLLTNIRNKYNSLLSDASHLEYQLSGNSRKRCSNSHCSRSQWPRGPRRRSAAARLLESWVRIPLGAWKFLCCECCVLSDRGLCDEQVTRPEESYRLQCVVVCNLENAWMAGHNQSLVTELNRRYITGCLSCRPLIVTVKHDCWMSSDRLHCSGK